MYFAPWFLVAAALVFLVRRLDAPDCELREQPCGTSVAREQAAAPGAVITPRGTKRSRPTSSVDEFVPPLVLATSTRRSLMDGAAADVSSGDEHERTATDAGGVAEAGQPNEPAAAPAVVPDASQLQSTPTPTPPSAGAASADTEAMDTGPAIGSDQHQQQLEQQHDGMPSPTPVVSSPRLGGDGAAGRRSDAADVQEASANAATEAEHVSGSSPAASGTPALLEQLGKLEVFQATSGRVEQQLRTADEPLSAIRRLMSCMLCLISVSRELPMLGGPTGFRRAVLAQGIPRSLVLLLKRFIGFRRGPLRDAALSTLRVSARLVVCALPLDVPEALDILARLFTLENYGTAVLIVSQFGRRGGVYRSQPMGTSLDTSPLLGDDDADIGDLDDDEDDDVDDKATALALALSRRELSSFDLDPAVLEAISGVVGDKDFVGPLVQPPSSMASYSSSGSEESIGVPPIRDRSRDFDDPVDITNALGDDGGDFDSTVAALARAEADSKSRVEGAESWRAGGLAGGAGAPAGGGALADRPARAPARSRDDSCAADQAAGGQAPPSGDIPAGDTGRGPSDERPSRMDLQQSVDGSPDTDVDGAEPVDVAWNDQYVTSTLYSTTTEAQTGATPDANDAVLGLASVVNVFGRHGGFEYLLARLQRGVPHLLRVASDEAPVGGDNASQSGLSPPKPADADQSEAADAADGFLTMYQVKALLFAPYKVRFLFAPPRVDARGVVSKGKLSIFASSALEAVFMRILSLSDEELKNEDRQAIDAALHMAIDFVRATRVATAVRRNDIVVTDGAELSPAVRRGLMVAAQQAELQAEQEVEHLYLKLIVKRLRSRFLEQRLIGMADLKAKVASAAQEGVGAASEAKVSGQGGANVQVSCATAAGSGRSAVNVEGGVTAATVGASTTGTAGALQPVGAGDENAPPAGQPPTAAEPPALERPGPSPLLGTVDAGLISDASGHVQPVAGEAKAPDVSPAHDATSLVMPTKPVVSAATLCVWLNDAGIVELIFDRGRLHAEVIKRSSEVLQFLAARNALSAAHIDTLWAATRGTHESVAHTVYLVLAELPQSLRPGLTDQLWCRIRSVPAAEYDTQLVQLVSSFTYGTLMSPMITFVRRASLHSEQRVPPPQGPADGAQGMDCGPIGMEAAGAGAGATPLVGPPEWFGITRLWELIQDGQAVADAVFDSAWSSLHDFLVWDVCESRRKPMILACIRNLKRHQSQPQSIQLLCALISTKPSGMSAGSAAGGVADTFASFLRALDREVNLVQVVVDDYQVYSAQAVRAAVPGGAFGPGMDLNYARLVPTSRPGHLRQVHLRLQLLALCITNPAEIFALSRAQVDVLWACSVDRAVTRAERDSFFSWLCYCCTDLVGRHGAQPDAAAPAGGTLPAPPSSMMTGVTAAVDAQADAAPAADAAGADGSTTRSPSDANVHITTASGGLSVVEYIFFEKLRRMNAEVLSERAALCAEVYFRLVNWSAGRLLVVDADGAPAGDGHVRSQIPFTTKLNNRLFPFDCVVGTPVSSNFVVLAPQLLGVDVIWMLALDAEDATDGARASALLLRLYLRHERQFSTSTGARLSEFVSLCMQHLSTAATGSSASKLARQRAGRCILLLRSFLDEFDAVISRAGLAVTDRRHSARTLGKPLVLGVIVISGGRLELECHSNDALGALRARIASGLNALGGSAAVPPAGVRIITAGKELRDDARTLGELRIIDRQQLHVARRVQPASSGSAPASGGGRSSLSTVGDRDGGAAPSGDGAMDSGIPPTVAAPRYATVSALDLVELGSDVVPRRVLSRSPYFDHLFQLMEGSDEGLSSQLWELLMRLPTNEATLEALQNPDSVAEWRSLLDAASPFRVHYALQIIDSLCQSHAADDVEMDKVGADARVSSAAAAAGAEEAAVDAAPADGQVDEQPSAPRSWRTRFVSGGGLTYLLEVLQTFDFQAEPWRSRRRSCLTLLLKVVNTFLVSGDLSSDAAEPPKLVLTPGLTLEGPALQALMKKLLQMSKDLSPCTPTSGGSAAVEHGEDLIVKPVVSLVVAAARSSPALLDWFCGCDDFSSWLYSILLRCTDERRREAAALSVRLLATLSSAARAALLVLLFNLLDSVVVVDSNNSYLTTEYFALLTELVEQCFRDSVAAAGSDGESVVPVDTAAIPVAVVDMQMKRLVDRVVALPVRERRPNDGVVDQVLVGLLEVLRVFLPCCQAWGLSHSVSELPATATPAWHSQGALSAEAAAPATAVSAGQVAPSRGQLLEGLCRVLTEHLHVCLFGKPTSTDHGPLAPPKCKTRATRAAAFRLLLGLTAFSPAVHAQVVGCLLETHRSMLETRRSALRFRSAWPGLPPTGGSAESTHAVTAGQLVVGAQHYPWVPLVSSSDKAACGFVGLKNCGTTCYMNSLLQQLFMIPQFRTSVLRAPIDGSLDDSHTLAVHLQLLFSNLLLSEKRAFDTRGFCLAYKDSDGRPVNTAVQMDVDEFLNVLFDKLEKAVRGGPYEKLLEETFCGKLVNQVICRDLPFVSEREESFYVLSLDVKDKRSVLDSLDFYVQGDVLDGDNKYFCSQYDQHVVALKRTCLGALPHTLILHLKRFEFDFDTMRKVKVNDYCEFPAVLDMGPYTKRSLARRDASSHAGFGAAQRDDGGLAGDGAGAAHVAGAASGDATAEGDATSGAADAADDTQGLQYRLVGMLVHAGTADSGHYYSFVQERGTDRWIHFNDTITEPFDPADIPRTCYGGVESVSQWDPQAQKTVQWLQSKQHSAYMLFYERIEEVPASSGGSDASAVQVSATDPGIGLAGVGTDGAAADDGHSGAAGMDTQVASDAGQVGTCVELVPATLAGSAGSSPHSTAEGALAAAGVVPGPSDASVGASIQAIPAEVFRRVWNENALHFFDKHRLDPDYDDFLMELISRSCQTISASPVGDRPTPDPELVLRYAQVGLHFLLDGMARTKDKLKIASWSVLLDPLLAHVQASKWFLDVCCAEPFEWPLQLLVRCPHAETRKNVACLLRSAIVRLRTEEVENNLYLRFAPVVPKASSDGSVMQDTAAGDYPMPAVLRHDPTKLRTTPVAALGGALAPGSLVASFIDSLLSLLPVAHATGDWKHLTQLFWLLTWFASETAAERAFLLRRQVLARVLDLYLGDDSPCAPSRGDTPRTKRPKTEETMTRDVVRAVLPLVGLLARSMSFGDSHMSPMALRTVPQWGGRDDSPGAAGNGMVVAGSDAEAPTIAPAPTASAEPSSASPPSTKAVEERVVTDAAPESVDAPNCSLPVADAASAEANPHVSPALPSAALGQASSDDAAVRELTLLPSSPMDFELLTAPLFWANALRDDQNGVALSEVAVHVCINGAAASRVIIDTAIRGLNDANYPSFVAYFAVLRRLLTDCDDPLRNARVVYMMRSFVLMVQDNQAYQQATLHAVRFVLSLVNSTYSVTSLVADWLVTNTEQWLAAWLLWSEHALVRLEALQLVRRLASLSTDFHGRLCTDLITLLPVALTIAREAHAAQQQAPDQSAGPQLNLLAAYVHGLHVLLMEEGSYAVAAGAAGTSQVGDASGQGPSPSSRVGLSRLLPHLGMIGEILRVVDLRRLPCDESQVELMSLLRGLSGIEGVPLLMARQGPVATALRNFFIYVHQGDEALIAYNLRVLPLLYEVLERCCRADSTFVTQLIEQGDMTFALLYIYLAMDYVQLVLSHMPSLHTVLSYCAVSSPQFRSKHRSAVIERLFKILPSSALVANANLSVLAAADASLRFLHLVTRTRDDAAELRVNEADSKNLVAVLTVLADASGASAETHHVAFRAVDLYHHIALLQASDTVGTLTSLVPLFAPSLLKLLQVRTSASRQAAVSSQRVSAYNLILASMSYRPETSAQWIDVLQEDSESHARMMSRSSAGAEQPQQLSAATAAVAGDTDDAQSMAAAAEHVPPEVEPPMQVTEPHVQTVDPPIQGVPAEEAAAREPSRSPDRKSPSSESCQQLQQLSVSGTADAGAASASNGGVVGTSPRLDNQAAGAPGQQSTEAGTSGAANGGGAPAPVSVASPPPTSSLREPPEDKIRQSAAWKNIQHRLPLPIYSTQSGYDLLFIASMVARFAAYCTQSHGSVADGSSTRPRPDTQRRLNAASRLVSAALLVSIEKDSVHPAVADIVSNLLTEAERGRRAAVDRDATSGGGTTADGYEQGAADVGASPPAALAGTAANVRPPSPVLFVSPAAPVEPILLFYPRLALRSRFLSFATLSSESALALVERLLRCTTSPSAVVDSALSLSDLTAVRQMLVENVDALVSFASPEAPHGSEEAREDAASSQGGARDGDGHVPPRGVANGGEDGTAGAPGHPVPSAVDVPQPSLVDGPADGRGGESTTSATPGAGGAGDGVTGNVLPGVEPLVLKRLLTRTSAVLGTLAVVVSTGSARQRAFVRAMALDSPTSPVRRVLPLSLGAVWHESPPLEVVLRARATRLLLLVADGGDGGGGGSAWSDGGCPVGGSSATSGAAGAPVVAMDVAAVDAPPPAPPVPSAGPTDASIAAVDAVMAAAGSAGSGPDGAATTTAPAAEGAAGAAPTSGEPQRPATPVDTSIVTPPP